VLGYSYNVEVGYILLFEVIGIAAAYLFGSVMRMDRALCNFTIV